MGSVVWGAVLAVTLGLASCGPSAAAAPNLTFPFLPPLFGSACKESGVCGKGKCVENDNATFGYHCHCQDGWTQPAPAAAIHHSDDNHDFPTFLPCIIPNCTFNYTCGSETAAPSPLPQPKKSKPSIYDPCLWTDCGGGVCNNTSPFTHTCNCHEGFYNLFNSTPFPCYKDCSIGTDCKKLGLNIFNSTNSSHPPGRTDVAANQSNSHGMNLCAKTWHDWLAIVATLIVLRHM